MSIDRHTMTNEDVMYRNHAVAKNAKDSMVDGEDRVMIQFSKLVTTGDGKKYIRASVNFGKNQFKELIDKYGLQLQGRWEIWDKEKKKNIPFQE